MNYLCVLFLPMTMLFSGTSEEPGYGLLITGDSQMIIRGSTSINEFECHSGILFLEDTLSIRSDSGKFIFEKARMIFRIASIECGDRYSNRQMKNTLKSKIYPFIIVDLKSISPDPDNLFMPDALLRIELAGKEEFRTVRLTLQGYQSGSFIFRGKETLKMTAFDLDPPQPMMGLIKVNNELEIDFVLALKLVPLQNDFHH